MGLEYDKINESIQNVENAFLNQLFSESDFTYSELYLHYLEQFHKCCRYINKVTKPKYWDIDTKYFNHTYKPIENVRTH